MQTTYTTHTSHHRVAKHKRQHRTSYANSVSSRVYKKWREKNHTYTGIHIKIIVIKREMKEPKNLINHPSALERAARTQMSHIFSLPR